MVPVSEGLTFMIRCQTRGCNSWFEWTASKKWWHEIPSYHSKGCQEKAMRRIKNQTKFYCPHPTKKLYRSTEEARPIAAELSFRTSSLVGEYRCVCGGIHIGSKQYRLHNKEHAVV